MKPRTPAQPHPQDGSLTLPRTQQVTQVSLPWCCVAAAPPNPIPAQPPSVTLPVSCFRATQTYHCGKMLGIPSETFPLAFPPSPKPASLCSCLSLPHLRPHSPAPKERLSPQGNQSWKRGGQLWGGWSSSTLGPFSSALPSHSPQGRPEEARVAEPEGQKRTSLQPPCSSHILGS